MTQLDPPSFVETSEKLLQVASQFGNHIKDWKQHVASSTSTLKTWQACLDQLRKPPKSVLPTDIMNLVAPSQKQGQGAHKVSRYQQQDLADNMQALYIELQQTAQQLAHLVDSAKETAEEYSRWLEMVPPCSKASGSYDWWSGSGVSDLGSDIGDGGSDVDSPTTMDVDSPAASPKSLHSNQLEPEEVGLLMWFISRAMAKQYSVLELITSALSLDTPEGEMFTYVHVWQLQPFIQEGVCDSLLAYVDDRAATISKQ